MQGVDRAGNSGIMHTAVVIAATTAGKAYVQRKEKWRWARDSNPGTAINRRRFSRPLHSATLPAHRLVEALGNASASCLVDSGRNDTGFAPSVNALQEKQSKFRGFWSELRQDYRVLMESIWCFSVVND